MHPQSHGAATRRLLTAPRSPAQARQQDEAAAQLQAEKKALVETVRRQAQSVARLDAFRRNLLATLQTSPDVRTWQ